MPNSAPVPGPNPSRRTSVLIVEDDPAARKAITRILSRRGYAVSEAGTVADALCRARAKPPDWILLDLMLPDGNGLEVLRGARRDQLASSICVITGCAADMLNEARRAGADHTFTKPLDVERLLAVLGTWAAGSA